MPYLIKTTFAFAGQEQGWTETFYWYKNDSDLNDAEAQVTPLAQKRAKLLSKDYTLTIGRNAVVVSNAGAKVKRVTDIFEPRFAGIQSWPSTTPNVALLCNWQNATNTVKKLQYMRGIPAGIADTGKGPDLTYAGFLSYFNQWRAAMIAFKAGWIATEVTQTANITNYTQSNTNGIVSLTLAAPGFTWPVPPGFQTSVHIQLPEKNPMDGTQLVVPVSDTTCYTARPFGVRPFPTGLLGVMQVRSPRVITLEPTVSGGPAGQIHPQRVVTHKTGAPSYASRGRVSARTHW